MKKGIIAVEDIHSLTNEMHDTIVKQAKEHHVEIEGVIEYPRGAILASAEMFIDVMKRLDVDYAFINSPEFIISEWMTEGKLSILAHQEDKKIIYGTLQKEIGDIVKMIPNGIKESILKHIDIPVIQNKKDVIAACKHSAIVITKNVESFTIDEFMSHHKDDMFQSVHILEVSEMDELTEKEILFRIEKENIDNVYLYDEYNSPEIDSLLNKLMEKDIRVTYHMDEEMCMDYSGMHMN